MSVTGISSTVRKVMFHPLGSGRVLIVGGEDGSSNQLSGVFDLDLTAGTKVDKTSIPTNYFLSAKYHWGYYASNVDPDDSQKVHFYNFFDSNQTGYLLTYHLTDDADSQKSRQ